MKLPTTAVSNAAKKLELKRTTLPSPTQLSAMEWKEGMGSQPQNGAEVILELFRTNGTDCIFASPIAAMAPVWEALAALRP